MAERSAQRDVALCVALVAATVAVYAGVRDHDFVNFDDTLYVTANPVVQQGLTWEGARWALTATAAQNWHPVTWLSHMLDVSLFGVAAGPHLLMNVALHALATLLCFALFRTTTGQAWPSATVAALFALHPAHVESVAWVSERRDVLTGVFGFATMLAWVRWRRRPTAARYAAVALLLALGLMAKPMLVTLPAVLLLLDVWPLRTAPPWRAGVLLDKLPLLALAAGSALATVAAQWWGGAVAAVSALPLDERIANAALAYVRYLGLLVWPVDLGLVYPLVVPVPRGPALAAGALLIALTAGALWLGRRRPWVAVGWLWYVGMLVPVIGIVQVGEQALADRYTYLPFTGLFVMVAWTGAELIAARPRLRPVLAGGAVAALLACAALTAHQVTFWRDSETIFRRTVEVAPEENHLAWHGLGLALAAKGRPADAVAAQREAVRAWPDYVEAWLEIARLLPPDDAAGQAEALGAIVRLRPAAADVRVAYATALFYAGRPGDAVATLRAGVAVDPAAIPVANLLAWTLATWPDPALRNPGEALAVAERALAAGGAGDASMTDTLAAALAASGRYPDAVREADKAAELARAAGDQDLAAAITARRSLYASGRPWVDPGA